MPKFISIFLNRVLDDEFGLVGAEELLDLDFFMLEDFVILEEAPQLFHAMGRQLL